MYCCIKCFNALKKLNSLNENIQKGVIAKCKPEIIDAISEIALNCCEGTIPLSKKHHIFLKKYKKALWLLANPKVPIRDRKEVLIQKGGFLPILLKLGLPIIADLIFRKFSK